MVNVAQRPMEEAVVRRVPAVPRRATALLPVAPDEYRDAPADILTRHQFLRQLRLERRRSDRSRAELSLVLLRCAKARYDDGADAGELAAIVLRVRRETDVLGYLDDGLLAVLLTHTGAAGREAFIRKILAGAEGLAHEVSAGTYPNQLFESVLAEYRHRPDTLPFFIDDRPARTRSLRRGAKRVLDVVGSLVLLAALSPVMLAAALAVKASSPGPAIYRQIRLGRGGVPFVFYKFRSMRTDTDDGVHRTYVTRLIRGEVDAAEQGDANHPHYKLRSDARVTRVGRILRRTSVDELPQLLNVLKGEMSLVGPRPPIPYEVENYQSWHLRRVLETTPGITGLWQVEGRNRVSFDEMVRLDLRYVRTWSLRLDLWILLRTIRAVLRFDGGN